jgi:hypothetical protein
MSEMHSLLEKSEKRFYDRLEPFIGFIICLGAAIGFSFTAIWPLVFLAGFLGGIFVQKVWQGAVIGFLGCLSAWSVYAIIKTTAINTNILFNQIMGIFFSSQNLGWLLIILIILVGGIFGLLGSVIGSGCRIFWHIFQQNKTTREKDVQKE